MVKAQDVLAVHLTISKWQVGKFNKKSPRCFFTEPTQQQQQKKKKKNLHAGFICIRKKKLLNLQTRGGFDGPYLGGASPLSLFF